MGSQLSARIRKKPDEAHSRRREIERLYKIQPEIAFGEGQRHQLRMQFQITFVESFEAGVAETISSAEAKFSIGRGMGPLISYERK